MTSGPDREPVRLNKLLASAGVCSRRHADELIRQGRVRIDGRVEDNPGTKVSPDRAVTVNGRPLPSPLREHVYLMLNKPRGVLTTANDPQGRRTVLDLLDPNMRERRVFPVGRLDAGSEGLLILTTDGDLALRLTHPGFHHPKIYHVTVDGEVRDRDLDLMRHGMTLAEGDHLAPVSVHVLERRGKNRTRLEMVLIQGVNRQIRRMCRDVGLNVVRLMRVAVGPLRLGGLRVGRWRKLTAEEVEALVAAAGSGRRKLSEP
ncbi:MAG: rRNA pseudouridine synthase [Deltaproteobacteria bacterium]|nr:rRNA pseudouridine synthase [Deltaproteobacteria bacterium]